MILKKDLNINSDDKKISALKEQPTTNKEELKTTLQETIINKNNDSGENDLSKKDKISVLKEQLTTNKDELKAIVQDSVKKDAKEIKSEKKC